MKLSVFNRDVTLYCQGDKDLLHLPKACVVGSKRPSDESRALVREWATKLAQEGYVVVSGMSGCSVEAHKAAIRAGGRVIGVLATPLAQTVQARNADLQALIGQEHLLLSTYQQDTVTIPQHFTLRNKVFAALCDVCVLIEGPPGSGALSTARFFRALDKPVHTTYLVDGSETALLTDEWSYL